MMPAEHLINEPAADPAVWMLDPAVVFLNHGSFGSCPRPVLEFQRECADRMERQPVQFLAAIWKKMLDDARGALAQFLGAKAEDLVFVSSATAGINSVLRSLRFEPGDELLVTNRSTTPPGTRWNSWRNGRAARRWWRGFPFRCNRRSNPGGDHGRCDARTRLALIDHVTSQTGMVAAACPDCGRTQCARH